MKSLIKTLSIAGIAVAAATFSTVTLAHDGGDWRRDRFEDRREARWERHEWRHHHHHHPRFVEREVIYVPQRAPVVYAPPVVYRPARPVITISTPDIIIPF